MNNSFQIFKISGISIRIDYTWFIVFALVALSLGGNYFPKIYGGWPPELYWAMGIVTAILFFASVLAHELAHSLVSKARGVPVESITLFIFGGVARITDEPKNAGSEFWMALAGPATSVGTGIVFWLIHLLVGKSRTPIYALTAWLSYINLLVAGFNLIPGFPLDGGRILRAIIWQITKDLKKSTRIASVIGQIVAYLFILWGIRVLISGNLFNGIWIAFIGWFLLNAASSSYRQLAMREMLRGVKVREIMVTDCHGLPKDMPVKELIDEQILYTTRRCFPVTDIDKIIGIITLHNVKGIPKEEWENTKIESVMIPLEELKTVHPDDDLYKVMRQMTEEGVNQLPVLENGQLVGMIARDNLLSFMNARSELGI